MGRGALRRESPLPALRAGLQGAGEPGTRVRGEAGQGVVQPGLSPVTPRSRFLPHAGPPLCSPLSPAFLLLTHPCRHRISSLGRGMPAWRTGLGPSNGSCSTAPRLHRRETAGLPQAGRGAMAAVPAGDRGGDGERVNSEPRPSSPGGCGRCHPRSRDGLAARRGTGAPGSPRAPAHLRGLPRLPCVLWGRAWGEKGAISPLSPLPPRLPAPSGSCALAAPSRARRVGECELATGSLLSAFWGALCVCTPEAVFADNSLGALCGVFAFSPSLGAAQRPVSFLFGERMEV